jgi:type IV pilus assembly protein PilX
MKPIPMPLSGRRAQRGAVLLFALIALVVLLIGTVALMRSMNTSLFTAGNFGFKRDLTNQGERAVAAVLDLVQTGALGSDAAREASAAARNYSASILPTNGEGIPLALLSDAAFAAVGAAGNDISAADMGVTVRYVIDRLCVATGPATPASCAVFSPPPQGGSSGAKDHDEPPTRFVYRVSIRVDGPRRTQSFFQSTFTI